MDHHHWLEERTSENTNGRKTAKLGENLRGETGSQQAGQDTDTNTKHTEHVTHASSVLGRKAGERTNAENGANKITGLDEASSASSGSSDEATSTNDSRDGVQPRELWRISWS